MHLDQVRLIQGIRNVWYNVQNVSSAINSLYQQTKKRNYIIPIDIKEPKTYNVLRIKFN